MTDFQNKTTIEMISDIEKSIDLLNIERNRLLETSKGLIARSLKKHVAKFGDADEFGNFYTGGTIGWVSSKESTWIPKLKDRGFTTDNNGK